MLSANRIGDRHGGADRGNQDCSIVRIGFGQFSGSTEIYRSTNIRTVKVAYDGSVAPPNWCRGVKATVYLELKQAAAPKVRRNVDAAIRCTFACNAAGVAGSCGRPPFDALQETKGCYVAHDPGQPRNRFRSAAPKQSSTAEVQTPLSGQPRGPGAGSLLAGRCKI